MELERKDIRTTGAYIAAERTLMRTARAVSLVFTPFSIPFLAFLALFLFTYLGTMTLKYKLLVLAIVYCFTILLPTLGIFIFRKINGFGPDALRERRRRYVPFLLTIASYAVCLVLMHRIYLPWHMTGIIVAAIIVMLVCVLCNLKWKLSEHMAGAGAVIGGLVSFCYILDYNPVGWLSFFILISGLLGSARIILRHHTLSEVLGGFFAGLLCSLLVLHPVCYVVTHLFIDIITF